MTIDSKKVLFVTNSISGGGAERSAYQVYEELHRRGMNIKLCVLNSDVQDQIPVGVIALSRKWKSGFIETYRCFGRFREIVESEKPDILVSHCELPEMFSALVFAKSRKKIVVEHTSRPWHGRRKLGVLVRLLLKIQKFTWVTVSSDVAPIWLGDTSPIYISNPVANFHSSKSENSKEDLVFIGRIRKEKRPEWAIQAAIQNGLKIALYGIGEELASLEVKYSPKSETVIFKGFKSNPWAEISPNALIIVPSEFEGDGLVVVESILNGNPILLADNSDLHRFKLPAHHYFESQQALIDKVAGGKVEHFSSFLPSEEARLQISQQRNLNLIVDRWEEVLK